MPPDAARPPVERGRRCPTDGRPAGEALEGAIEGRTGPQEREIEAIFRQPATQDTGVSPGAIEADEPVVAVELAAVVDEDAQAGRVVDQEPAVEVLVEDVTARSFLLGAMQVGEQVDGPMVGVETGPASTDDRRRDAPGLEAQGERHQGGGRDPGEPDGSRSGREVGPEPVAPRPPEPGRQPRMREDVRQGGERRHAEERGMPGPGHRQPEPEERDQPGRPPLPRGHAEDGDEVDEPERPDRQGLLAAGPGRLVLDDQPGEDGRTHEPEPGLREPDAVGIHERGEPAEDRDRRQHEAISRPHDRRIPPRQSGQGPSRDDEHESRDPAEDPPVDVGPDHEDRHELPEAPRREPSRLDISEPPAGQPEAEERGQVRPGEEVGRPDGQAQDDQGDRRRPGQAAPEESMRQPAVEQPKRGRRQQQEAIQPAEGVDGRHRALAEPLVRHPGPPGEREAEWIGVEQPSRG